jgi:uncharacterized protein DUF6932
VRSIVCSKPIYLLMQQWPNFDNNGDLSVGIYCAILSEVIAHFGTSTLQRCLIAQRLVRIYTLVRRTGQLVLFIIFVSFVTAKREPNDVDIFMMMEDSFDAQQVDSEAAIIFDHVAAQHYEGASVFWIRRMAAIDGEETAIQYWQNTREWTKRGIVEVIGHD